MTGRVRALLITPDDDLLAIQRWVMSTTLTGTPAATRRNAATDEPGTAGHAQGADPDTSPAPAGVAVPATSALPRRIRDVPPAAGPGSNVQPAGPDVLRRVLNGLNRL